ncbi:hypothetical protein P5706_15960 [Pseudomonas sp. ChxA]|uniref:hypothetical protein n=1 Tax=Pseudomonas sp. ChxA TaxID=3035473 RepID=UPI002555CFFB|nr:hypothetical protein [Pseudomonas sp. ChxA]MDL2185679.1 hypothetical protein [Pseudomonas sp. ChxA]
MKKDLLATCLAFSLTGCGDSGEMYKKQAEGLHSDVKSLQAEITAAKGRIAQLEQENTTLKETPSVLLTQVRKASDSGDEAATQAALASLTSRYPDSAEAKTGSGFLQRMVKDRETKEQEARRLAALGMKVIPVKGSFIADDSSVSLQSAQIAGQWSFNDYGDEYEYRSAERGSKYITAKVTYSSKSKDPRLAPLVVYASNGGELKRLGVMGFEFVSWSSYATFLGNYHDDANDFAHKVSISFSMGLQVPNEAIIKPLYIVASFSGCADRSSDRFGNPPVSYTTYSCDQAAPSVLRASDFKEGRFGIVKRID